MGPSAVRRFGKDHHALTTWALDCAERVLPFFEEHRPGDLRVRHALDAGRAWLRSDITMDDARPFAGHAPHAAAYAVSAVIAAGGDEVAEMQWQRARCPRRLHLVAFPATASYA